MLRNAEVTFNDLKKAVDKEKAAAEQEKLRKIQVWLHYY